MDPRLTPLFPRDLYGRLALGIASLFFFPLSTAGAFAFFAQTQPKNTLDWLFAVVVGELFVAMALFFGCGLIWAVAMPKWLESLLTSVTVKLMLALVIFLIPFTGVVLWAFIMS